MTFAWVALGVTVAIMLAAPAILFILGARARKAQWADRRGRLIQARLERVDEDAAWASWLAAPPMAIVTATFVTGTELLEAFMDAEARILRSLSLQRRPELVR